MSKKNKKRVVRAGEPSTGKKSWHAHDPEGYQHDFIAWHFQCMDSEGEWACTLADVAGMLPWLHQYERLRWWEVLSMPHNHPMPLDRIAPAAQKRLEEMSLADHPQLYQLKIPSGGGRQRLWGIRRENVFQILWWDPLHTVFPMERK